MQENEYNDEPVVYCKHCLYLGNPSEIAGITFCPYCGSTDFEESHIDVWDKKFQEKYKQGKFINIKKERGKDLWKKILTTNSQI